MTVLVDRWAPAAARLASVRRVSDAYIADRGAGHVSVVDQAVAGAKDLLLAHGLDVNDRDELMAAAVGAFLALACAKADAERAGGIVPPAHVATMELAAGEVGAIVVRLLDHTRRRWAVTFDERPFTTNAERKGSRFTRAADVKRWRDAFHVLAKAQRIPTLDRISVEVRPLFHTGRAMQDVAGCAPAAKAAIDGLVDAGVIPDDTPRHLIGQTFRPPVVDPTRRGDALQLVVTEEPSL